MVISEQAVDFRDDIEGFRPGDPDGEYAFVGGACNSPGECNDMLDENPYIKSLVGFIILPFIFNICTGDPDPTRSRFYISLSNI